MPDVNQTPVWLQRTETILEELNEGVVIADSQLRVVFANEALLRLIRYKRNEIQAHTPDALFPPEAMPHIIQQHESCHRYRHSRSEVYLPRKDGEKIPAILSGREVEGPDGQTYTLLVVTDISAQKRVEEQLRESNAVLEQHQKAIEAELSLAARVQQSLAPHSLVWNDILIETCYSPARTIGGDFGVVCPHAEEALTVLLCDVSGHGIGPALMANRIYSETLHQLEGDMKPPSLLRHVHEFVLDRLAADSFYFTMAAARFTSGGRRATFAGGGHPPAMLTSNGRLRLLDSQNGILGCVPEIAPSASADEIQLEPGDRLILYTDGLTEVFNTHDEMLGIGGFAQLVHDSAKLRLPEMRKAIINGVNRWSRGPLADDVSLVIVEVR